MAKAKTTKKASTEKKTTKATSAVTKIKEAVTKNAAIAKAATTKKVAVAEAKTNVTLQYADKDLSYNDLIQNAKNVFQYDMSGDPNSINKLDLFVKPDENKVYFVINDDIQGSYDL